jgi:hypothetical protein
MLEDEWAYCYAKHVRRPYQVLSGVKVTDEYLVRKFLWMHYVAHVPFWLRLCLFVLTRC